MARTGLLNELGITKFKDLTPEKWKVIYDKAEKEDIQQDLIWLITLALFYREEVRHPEWYVFQCAAGESQLP